MPRGIVYPSVVQRRAAPRGGGTDDGFGSPLAGDDPAGAPDGYAEKLAKYVPAEAVALLATVGSADVNDALRWLVVVVAAAGSVLYLGRRGSPPLWFYGLALVSFAGWVIGATEYGEELLGVGPAAGGVVLALVVFFVPAADEALTRATAGRA